MRSLGFDPRQIVARAVTAGRIKPGTTAPIGSPQRLGKHDDRTVPVVLARHGGTIRAIATITGIEPEAIAGRGARCDVVAARRACWRKLVAGGASVARLAEDWGVSYRTVATAMQTVPH